MIAQAGLLAVLMWTAPDFHRFGSVVHIDVTANRGVCPMARAPTVGGTQGAAHPPTWPSVEEQLAASKVIHGSALEKLVRDNQDFTVLRPQEAHDDIGLPLWLRVWWRKNHPDEPYSRVDPAGGYPDILYDIHQRMMRNQDLLWGSATAGTRGQPGGTP